MTDEDTVKATLRRLAQGAGDGQQTERPSPSLRAEHRQTIERATAALGDIEETAAFFDDGGLSDLERAVEAAEQSVSQHADRGRTTLDEYRRLRAVLADEQFHSGRGTSLGDGDKAETR